MISIHVYISLITKVIKLTLRVIGLHVTVIISRDLCACVLHHETKKINRFWYSIGESLNWTGKLLNGCIKFQSNLGFLLEEDKTFSGCSSVYAGQIL